MLRRALQTVVLVVLIGLLAAGCGKREEVVQSTGQDLLADVSGTYRGATTLEVGKDRIPFKAEMKINADGYVERLYWQDIRNRVRTDEIEWTYPNSCDFFRTHYRSERQFQQAKWGEVHLKRELEHLTMSAHLPLAADITELRVEYDYPAGAVNAYDPGGRLNWNPVDRCLTANVRAIIPPIPATAKPRGSFMVVFGKSRILKVIPGAQAMNRSPTGAGPTITKKKLADFKRVKLTHSPGTWFIDAFNVDARVNRSALIEFRETSYAFELADNLMWEAVVNIYADGRRIVKVPSRNLVWEMKKRL